jgi:hypothetical protein
MCGAHEGSPDRNATLRSGPQIAFIAKGTAHWMRHEDVVKVAAVNMCRPTDIICRGHGDTARQRIARRLIVSGVTINQAGNHGLTAPRYHKSHWIFGIGGKWCG